MRRTKWIISRFHCESCLCLYVCVSVFYQFVFWQKTDLLYFFKLHLFSKMIYKQFFSKFCIWNTETMLFLFKFIRLTFLIRFVRLFGAKKNFIFSLKKSKKNSLLFAHAKRLRDVGNITHNALTKCWYMELNLLGMCISWRSIIFGSKW